MRTVNGLLWWLSLQLWSLQNRLLKWWMHRHVSQARQLLTPLSRNQIAVSSLRTLDRINELVEIGRAFDLLRGMESDEHDDAIRSEGAEGNDPQGPGGDRRRTA